MKKIYISPAALIVQLSTVQMMAESLPIGGSSDDTIDDEGDILTKENKDVNLWDEEW